MSDIDTFKELNSKIENSPKAMGCFTLFTKIVAIILILIFLLLCVAVPVVGIIGIIFGVFIFFIPKLRSNGTLKNLNKSLAINDTDLFEFPETDPNGHRLLTVYDINVTGVMHSHDGVDPQTIIPKLYEGEQIILETDLNNPYDAYAVKVKTTSGIQVGWLPKGKNLQMDVFKRLTEGQIVLARVKKGYLLNNYPGKVGLVIDVARYARK